MPSKIETCALFNLGSHCPKLNRFLADSGQVGPGGPAPRIINHHRTKSGRFLAIYGLWARKASAKLERRTDTRQKRREMAIGSDRDGKIRPSLFLMTESCQTKNKAPQSTTYT
ncbi:Hypothetical protein NTJ_12448 [Nesidiocoris tenuis]|uniref:Uncharacterized protein n=1 Tax=Nesidiocoris tenuis TaxID=355587 RepID=A0ABN7B8U5_9HEMI|nr:Hypothetical protein NTJ_12448 [Nesidiocoris tenuis]